MTRRMVWIVIVGICLLSLTVYAEPDKLTVDQKRKLGSLIKDIKRKQETAEPVKYEVTLPVSAAGVRGSKASAGNKFDVLWPESTITPLVALVNNLQSDIDKGKDGNVLREQLNDFLKVFPEFKNEKALQDIAGILK